MWQRPGIAFPPRAGLLVCRAQGRQRHRGARIAALDPPTAAISGRGRCAV